MARVALRAASGSARLRYARQRAHHVNVLRPGVQVDALNALSAHVRASVGAGAASNGLDTMPSPLLAAEPDKVQAALERVRERLMEALEDPHLKVAFDEGLPGTSRGYQCWECVCAAAVTRVVDRSWHTSRD